MQSEALMILSGISSAETYGGLGTGRVIKNPAMINSDLFSVIIFSGSTGCPVDPRRGVSQPRSASNRLVEANFSIGLNLTNCGALQESQLPIDLVTTL